MRIFIYIGTKSYCIYARPRPDEGSCSKYYLLTNLQAILNVSQPVFYYFTEARMTINLIQTTFFDKWERPDSDFCHRLKNTLIYS